MFLYVSVVVINWWDNSDSKPFFIIYEDIGFKQKQKRLFHFHFDENLISLLNIIIMENVPIISGANHFGMAGWWGLHAAKKGFIGMCFTNTSPFMAPTRSKKVKVTICAY